MDIRELFKKYIKHVGDTEGTWCLVEIYDRTDRFGNEKFTEEEWNYLQELLKETINDGRN